MRVKILFLSFLITLKLFSSDFFPYIEDGAKYRYSVEGFLEEKEFAFPLTISFQRMGDQIILSLISENPDHVEFSCQVDNPTCVKTDPKKVLAVSKKVAEVNGMKLDDAHRLITGLIKAFSGLFLGPLTGALPGDCTIRDDSENKWVSLLVQDEVWEIDAEIDDDRHIWESVEILIKGYCHEHLLLIIVTVEP